MDPWKRMRLAALIWAAKLERESLPQYRLVLDERRGYEIEALPAKVQDAIENKLHQMIQELDKGCLRTGKQPTDCKPLKPQAPGYYRLKVGNSYRVIYTYDGNRVLVVAVGSREDVYRVLPKLPKTA